MAFGSKTEKVEKVHPDRQRELDRRAAITKAQAENDKRGALTHVKASR